MSASYGTTLKARRLLFLAILGLILSVERVFADEPASWSDFKVQSKNGEYTADIRLNSEVEMRSQGGYSLSVYPTANPSKILWSSPYRYDGYSWGNLSDDGKAFVYVNFWYDDNSVVFIYREGQSVKEITGREFAVDPTKMQATVSNRLWLADEESNVRFEGSDVLVIKTRDDKIHTIDLLIGKIVP